MINEKRGRRMEQSDFKYINMGFNYKLAVELMDLFNSNINDIEIRLEALVCLDTISYKELIINKLLIPNCNILYKPNKYSLLHLFIENYLYYYIMHERYYLLDELCSDYEEGDIIIEYIDRIANIINEYDIDTEQYKAEIRQLLEYDETYLNNHHYIKQEIAKLFDRLIENFDNIEKDIVNATFYILYNNKDFLFSFNNYFRKYMNKNILPKDIFNEEGNIKRFNSLPKWLKRGVFYRDNARCQNCGKDLSGKIRILSDKEIQYDHIIPLAKGGSNDPTNFQLLCDKCNLDKNKDVRKIKYYYQMYW